VGNKHSIVFISCADSGFYSLSYYGDSDPHIYFRYDTYEGFLNQYSGRKIWLYNANTNQNSSASPCTVHASGTYSRTASAHPHYVYYICDKCGREYTDYETEHISSCSTCSNLRVLSTTSCGYEITVPANLKMFLCDDLTSNATGGCFPEQSASWKTTYYVKYEMSDGSVRMKVDWGNGTCAYMPIRSETGVTYQTIHRYYVTKEVQRTCTSGGYTVWKCDCGAGYELRSSIPLGHSYSNGICTICGAAKPNFHPLLAPSISVTSVPSSGKPKISWSAVENAVKYSVYRSLSESGTYVLVSSTTKTSLVHNKATAGTKYYYKVVALDSNGTASVDSNIVSRTCKCPRPQVTASVLSSSGKIRLSWEKVTGAVKYEICRSDSSKGEYQTLATTKSTSFTNTSAVAGKTYYYKVKAIAENTAANSAFSTVVSATCKSPTVYYSKKLSISYSSAGSGETITKSCSIDVTGDGKKDTVKLSGKTASSGSEFSKIWISVNGRTAYTTTKTSFVRNIKLNYVHMSNSKEFLELILMEGDYDVQHKLFRYDQDAKKLVSVANLASDRTVSSASIESVTASSIKVLFYGSTSVLGYMQYTRTMNYKDGTFSYSSTYTSSVKSSLGSFNVNDGYGKYFQKNQFVCNGSVTLTEKSTGGDPAFTAKAGNVLTLKQLRFYKGNVYAQFERNGNTGWLNVTSGSYSTFRGVANRQAN